MSYYRYPHEGRMVRYVAYSADWQRLGYADASKPDLVRGIMERRGVDSFAFAIPLSDVLAMAERESGQAYMRQLADPWDE